MTTQQLVDPSSFRKAFELARSPGTAMDLAIIKCLTGDQLEKSELELLLEMSATGHAVLSSGLKSTDVKAAFNRLKALADEPPTEI